LLGTFTLASCNKKDSYDYEAERARVLQQEQQFDALLTTQKASIEKYVQENFKGVAIVDTTKVPYSVYDKKTPRGIIYEMLAVPTEAEEKAYEYKIDANGQGLFIKYPKVTINYTVKLLNGNQVESANNELFNLNQNFPVRTPIWNFSFLPAKMKYNGIEYITNGLTKAGLKKGSKIRVVTPSAWAYGSVAKTNIPANSPLVYEFEVLKIED